MKIAVIGAGVTGLAAAARIVNLLWRIELMNLLEKICI